MSVLVKTRRAAPETAVLSLLLAGCVADFLEESGVGPEIKWPNDVLVNGKKISGILVRSSPAPDSGIDLVIGIGLNLRLDSIHHIPNATSLERETGRHIPQALVLDALLRLIGEMTADFESSNRSGRLDSVANRLAFRGEPVEIIAGSNVIRGTLEGVRSDGALCIATSPESREYVVSGELQRGPKRAESRD
jgi:BirA family biotin operon repressor/biotin-[acetyl-CoA-carboxylase] ligase